MTISRCSETKWKKTERILSAAFQKAGGKLLKSLLRKLVQTVKTLVEPEIMLLESMLAYYSMFLENFILPPIDMAISTAKTIGSAATSISNLGIDNSCKDSSIASSSLKDLGGGMLQIAKDCENKKNKMIERLDRTRRKLSALKKMKEFCDWLDSKIEAIPG